MTFLPDGEALKKLVNDRSVDVVVVVAAQPAKSLANLAPQIGRSIKLLKLDPRHPSSQRAIDAYLPAKIYAANYRTWLLEDIADAATMTFLVSTGETRPEATDRPENVRDALCRKLPVLRKEGHPKWREVQPHLEVDAGWPYSMLTKTAFQSCERQNPASEQS